MGQPVVHFEVVGKDPKKLRGFYGDLFGWEFDSVEGGPTDYATVSRDQNADDVGASLDKAEELGGTRTMGPAKPSPDMEMEIGLFTDPEGHTIGLVKMG